MKIIKNAIVFGLWATACVLVVVYETVVQQPPAARH